MPHAHFVPYGTLIYDYLKQFSRDLETGEIIYKQPERLALDIQLLLPPNTKILEKCAANIPVKVTPIGFTPESPVKVELKGQDGTLYGTAYTDNEGNALVKASVFPEAGTYAFTTTCGSVSTLTSRPIPCYWKSWPRPTRRRKRVLS